MAKQVEQRHCPELALFPNVQQKHYETSYRTHDRQLKGVQLLAVM